MVERSPEETDGGHCGARPTVLSFDAGMTPNAPPDGSSPDGARGEEHLLADLTPRELEVLMGVRAGLTSKEIAGDLGISESTVNKHVTAAMRALAARSRSHAVAVLDALLDAHHGPDGGAAQGAFADSLVRVLALLVGADSVFLAMWEHGRLHVIAAVGTELSAGSTLDAGNGWATLAFRRDRVVSIGDRAQLQATLRLPAGPESGSAVAAPVHANGAVIGVLAATSSVAGHFVHAHLELLSLAAELAGGQLVATPARGA